MIKTITLITLSLGISSLLALPSVADVPLQPLAAKHQQLKRWGLDEQIWGSSGDKQALLTAIDQSLVYLRSRRSLVDYLRYPSQEITRSRVTQSLIRFRQLILSCDSPAELLAALRREFVFYQSSGQDGKGKVLFTAYYEPIYPASRVRTKEYRYPLYQLPPDFASWSKPHPTRVELEGKDGLFKSSQLRGLELVWLRDRFAAFLVQIQGSARLQLTDGTTMSVGYAGKTNHPYTSIGKELVKDGKLSAQSVTLPAIINYFRQHPQELNNYLPRYRTFVFFQDTHGALPSGSLGVPVTAERSIATDKSLMPPGALALIYTQIPYPNKNGRLEQRTVSRYVLDQDTGGAIKGAGRVDYFLGTGIAGDRAGITLSDGHLYYLLLK